MTNFNQEASKSIGKMNSHKENGMANFGARAGAGPRCSQTAPDALIVQLVGMNNMLD